MWPPSAANRRSSMLSPRGCGEQGSGARRGVRRARGRRLRAVGGVGARLDRARAAGRIRGALLGVVGGVVVVAPAAAVLAVSVAVGGGPLLAVGGGLLLAVVGCA